MGLSLPTTPLVYLLCAICKAPATCTIILLPSLADLSGVFDIPTSKCPPDRGSSDCVTGSPASMVSSSPFSDISSSPSRDYVATKSLSHHPDSYHNTDYVFSGRKDAAMPQAIPRRSSSPYNIATPPLTPDDDEEDEDGGNWASGITTEHSKDALELLLNFFPHDGMKMLPFAKSVTVSAPNMGTTFDGLVVKLPGQPKTLYVDGQNAETVSLRESIVALLDLADEHLECSCLVIALDKSSPALGELLHSLMYVGGTVVTQPPFQVDPAYVLVGLEI